MEYKRKIAEDIDPLVRIHNWGEFHHHLPQEKQQVQGARCMDCGTPFCQTGILINGMASGCPINNLIPEWNDLIYRGQWKEALQRLHKTNNFPEFTGRVCPAPCEASCTVAIHDPAVTIKSNECAIIDRGWQEGWVVPHFHKQRTGKKVAVVGSGPAGLSCADQLNHAGHQVDVYERADRIGGLLMYGIPNMKLDKNVVQRRLDLMTAEGVAFKTGVEIDKNISSQELVDCYDAVVLCCGATKPRDLPIEGRNLKGVHFAMEFLSSNTKSLLDSGHKDGNYISAKGKDVMIIGGGDTGTDCVGTAIRHGCKSVVQLEIMDMPPLFRAPDNPWPQWPKTLKVDYGQEEAKALFGKDPREFGITAKKFVGDDTAHLKEVHTIQIEWKKDANGRFGPVEIPGTEKVWPCQLVLLAMGFLGPEDTVITQLGLERDVRSNVKADHGKFLTSVPKVFAAGDMRRGQSLVVWAINEGRGAARECDRFLRGKTNLK